MSPEQTGRLSRPIDYRSDLWGLGVVFYRLLCGVLPFTADDPLDLIHSIIAKQPVPPNQLRDDLPDIVSSIIMKLLSKNAELRYQSAYGAMHDLKRCLQQAIQQRDQQLSMLDNASDAIKKSTSNNDVATTIKKRLSSNPSNTEQYNDSSDVSDSNISTSQHRFTYHLKPFPLAVHDVAYRLHIPNKLYGRDKDIGTLQTSFEYMMSSGDVTVVTVKGQTGLGKTSLVKAVSEHFTTRGAVFVTSKLDSILHTPYSLYEQLVTEWVLDVLRCDSVMVAKYKRKLIKTLGVNASLITDLFPIVEHIIGQHDSAPQMMSVEAAARMKIVFVKFLTCLSNKRRPLVIFLDDLQWSVCRTINIQIQ